MKRAQQLLKESGYDGTTVVLIHPTDIAVIAKLPTVAAQLLRQAGFKVDVQSMDFQTAVARWSKRDPPSKGGWNIYLAELHRGRPLGPARVAADECLVRESDVRVGPAMQSWRSLRDAYLRAQTAQERKPIGRDRRRSGPSRSARMCRSASTSCEPAARKNIRGFFSRLPATGLGSQEE